MSGDLFFIPKYVFACLGTLEIGLIADRDKLSDPLKDKESEPYVLSSSFPSLEVR